MCEHSGLILPSLAFIANEDHADKLKRILVDEAFDYSAAHAKHSTQELTNQGGHSTDDRDKHYGPPCCFVSLL
jgi:hypothetical protein